MLGHSACSKSRINQPFDRLTGYYIPAKRSRAVSSRTEEATAPALVAPIAQERASAVDKPVPDPSCSTEMKQGKPFPFW